MSLCLFVFSGCSHLLYYPTQVEHARFENLPVKSQELLIGEHNLHARYFQGRSKQKPKGLMVLFHGNAQNLSSHAFNLLWVVDHGYDFLIFDYRGYGKSPGKPSPKNTLEDALAVLDFIKEKQPQLPLILVGQSLGGAILQRALLERKDLKPKLLVIDSSFHSYREVGRKVLASTWLSWPFQWLSYLLLSDRYAPGKKIRELGDYPKLVIIGTNDPVVSPTLGKKVFEYLSEAKTLWTIKGGMHGDVFHRDNFIYRKRFLEFLEQSKK